MLVLTRGVREVVRISDDIKVVILSIKNGKVRLGVECDRSIPVHREEVWEQLKEGRELE